MARCWNCGLPDVAERCPRCGAPQERRGPGMPPDEPPRPASRPLQRPAPRPGPRPPGFAPDGSMPPPGLPARQVSQPMPPDEWPGQVPPQPPYPRQGPPYPQQQGSGPLPPGRQGSGQVPYQGPGSGPLAYPAPDAPPRYPPRPSGPLPSQQGRAAPPHYGPPEYDQGPTQSPGDSGSYPWPAERRPPRPPTGAWPAPQAAPEEMWEEEEPMPPPRSRGRSQPVAPAYPPDERDEEAEEIDTSFLAPYPAGSASAVQKAVPADDGARRSVWDEDERPGWADAEPLTLSASLNAFVGGAVGGVFGGVIWIAITVVLGTPLPYLAPLVGIVAGLGARYVLFITRPWTLGLFAALGAALAFVVTQYGLLDYALAQATIRQGLFTTWFPLSLGDFPRVYWDYVTGLADPVTTAIGQATEHPLQVAEALVCMGIAWVLLLVWRKR